MTRTRKSIAAAHVVEVWRIARLLRSLRREGGKENGFASAPARRGYPSFRVNPEKSLFHCFGCGTGGSVIDLYGLYVASLAKARNLSNGELRNWPCFIGDMPMDA